MSFEEKRPRKQTPGSAAESNVRPPKVSQVWPPKVMFGFRRLHGFACSLGRRRWGGWPPIKGTLTENWGAFSLVFWHRWVHAILGCFHGFPSNLSRFLWVLSLFWRVVSFEQGFEVWGLWSLDSPSLHVCGRTNSCSSRGSDLRDRGGRQC